MRGLHLHFDLASGAAGDMVLGALLDLGVPRDVISEALARLPIGGYDLVIDAVKRAGLVGTRVEVQLADHEHHEDGRHADHPHRHYTDIRRLIASSDLPGPVEERALAIFERVARAEARLHGVTPDAVAFHEVGAIDSIVDIVGVAAALAWLEPASVSSTPVPMGHGTVRCAHGVYPVPAPAALEILALAGAPVVDGGADRELTTPTGAAILAATVQRYGLMPPLEVRAVGYGAGAAELPDRPNLLRVILGRETAEVTGASLLRVEANIDDMSPELCENAAELLFAAGAVDVWWTPVVMKKSRPAFMLGVLCPPARLEAIVEVILRETTTIGVRWDPVARRTLPRRVEEVDTAYGRIQVKVAFAGERILQIAPEYESCRAAARRAEVPVKQVYAAALAAFGRR